MGTEVENEAVRLFMTYFEGHIPGGVDVEFDLVGDDELELVPACSHEGYRVMQRISIKKIQNCRSPENLAAIHASAFRTKLLAMELES